MEVLRYVGAIICHQLPDKTFSVGTLSCWICFRCSGIYFGFVMGATFHFLSNRKTFLPWGTILISILFMVICFIDAVFTTDLWKVEHNFASFFTGILCGIGIGLILVPISQSNLGSKKNNNALTKNEYVLKSNSPWFWGGIGLPVTLLVFWRSVYSVCFISLVSFLGFLFLGVLLNAIAINKTMRTLVRPCISRINLCGASLVLLIAEIVLIGAIK